jgi:predicted protein tyrosine phosphatase
MKAAAGSIDAIRMINALFVCGKNKLRSPTAEAVFSRWLDVETDSAGLSTDADVVLTPEQIDWADIIFVMEKTQRIKLARQFKRVLNGKRIICLDIADDYTYMQPELVKLLEAKAGPLLR